MVMSTAFKEYKRATLPKRAALTHAALEWWAAAGFEDAALRGPNDDGHVHLEGKIHDEMLKQSVRPGGITDYLPVSLLMETGALVLPSKNPENERDSVINLVLELFQEIFTDKVAVVFSPKREEGWPGVEMMKAAVADLPDAEKAAGVLLMLRDVGLQPTLQLMEAKSLNMARIASRIVENNPDDGGVAQQRDAYDAQVEGLQKGVRRVFKFEQVNLATIRQILARTPPTAPSEELQELRKKLMETESALKRCLKRQTTIKKSEKDANEARQDLISALNKAVSDLGRIQKNSAVIGDLVTRLKPFVPGLEKPTVIR